MIDIDLSIFDIYYDCSMVGLTCLGVMLYNQIPNFRLRRFLETPFFWILNEIFAVGASVVLIVKSGDCIDARLELLSRKCHVESTR